jgi:hypothetical protein
MMRAVGTIALCGAFVLGGSAPSFAAPKEPKAVFRITVAAKGTPAKSVYLNCMPDGGTHPAAHAACNLLRQVGGDPAKLNVSPKAACTKELKPAGVVIIGMWNGKPVKWGKVYGNSCLMKAGSGALTAI